MHLKAGTYARFGVYGEEDERYELLGVNFSEETAKHDAVPEIECGAARKILIVKIIALATRSARFDE